MKIIHKLILQSAAVFAGIAVTVIVSILMIYQAVSTERKNGVKAVVETASSIATDYNRRVEAGEISRDDAILAVSNIVRALRYGNNDYLYVYSDNGNTLVHGVNPKLEGKYRYDETDVNGKQFLHEQVAAAKAGGGFTEYYFPKKGEENPSPKISYDLYFKPWGWVIGSGVYVDDIDKSISSIGLYFISVAGVVFVLLFVATSKLGRSISRPIRLLSDLMADLAKGNADILIPGTSRTDEIGEMSKAVEVFRVNAIESKRIAEERTQEQRQKETKKRISERDRHSL